MLPRALAAAAYDEQVAVTHFVADCRAAAARPDASMRAASSEMIATQS
jgi:hypothetical protein